MKNFNIQQTINRSLNKYLYINQFGNRRKQKMLDARLIMH